MERLKDKVAIVTGGAGGIGRAICLLFALEGATVAVNYLHGETRAHDLIKEIQDQGGRGLLFKADVTRSEEVDSVVDELYGNCGRIDVLVNSAGIIRDQLIFQMEPSEWREVLDVNLTGLFNCTRAVAKYMMLQRSGKIINVSSIAGQKGGKGHCNYAASKGGVDAFTRSLAIELAPKGITVNAVAPGVIDTDMSETLLRRAQKEVLAQIPLKRLGTPEDVARTVLFLASDDADYITGEVIRVAGGMGV